MSVLLAGGVRLGRLSRYPQELLELVVLVGQVEVFVVLKESEIVEIDTILGIVAPATST